MHTQYSSVYNRTSNCILVDYSQVLRMDKTRHPCCELLSEMRSIHEYLNLKYNRTSNCILVDYSEVLASVNPLPVPLKIPTKIKGG